MYDMYPWDSASQGDYPPQALRSRRNPSREAPETRHGTSPARAVQVALDRRDNGGKAQAATSPAASTVPPASRARQ